MSNEDNITSQRQNHSGFGEGSETDLLWAHLKSVPAFRALLRAVESRFYQHIELPDPVLDLGCGDGLFADLTFDGKVAAGIDPWWGPLRKAEASGAYKTVAQGFGHALPYAEGYFGGAISNSVLEHISDLQPVLYEIHRVLRDDGLFVVTMPSHYYTSQLGGALALDKLRLKPLADAYRLAFNGIARHEHVDPPERWASRFADAGFSINRWQYYFSTKALHALEIGHLQGIPSAILHALTGHWIIAPWRSSLGITERWLRPFYEEEAPSTGTMILFILRKNPDRPVSIHLPEPQSIDLSHPDVEQPAPSSPKESPTSADLILQEDELRVDLPSKTVFNQFLDSDTQGESKLSWSFPRYLAGLLLLLASAAAAVISTSSFLRGGSAFLLAILWLLASVTALFLAGNPAIVAAARSKGRIAIREAPRRRWLVLVSILIALASYRLANGPSTENRSFAALVLWLLSIAAAGYALWKRNGGSFYLKPFRVPRRSWELPAILLLFLTALAVRVVDITTHPFILSGTEASIGLDAWAVAEGGIQSPFATAWLTNPTMPLYLLAVPVSIIGRTVLAVRVFSPFIGAVTVVAVYLFGRRLWGPFIGLIAAILLAGSHVHIHYSRLGMTNIWDSLLVTAALGFLYAAWQERSRKLRIIAGILTGLNAYLYTASHILPLILLALFIYSLKDWRELWEQRANLLSGAAMILIVSLPQLLYYRTNPALFFDRVNTLGIFQSGWLYRESDATGNSPIQLLFRQLWKGLLGFQTGVDNSTAYNPGVTMLGFWAALLMVLGLGLAIWRFKQLRYAILLIWTIVTLVFGGVLLDNPPNSHRLLIALPAVYLLISLAVVWLAYKSSQLLKISKRYAIPVAVAIVLVISAGDLFFYFGDYRHQARYGDRNTEVANEVSQFLETLDGQWLVYFYGAPSMYTSFPTFAYLVEEFGKDIHMVDVEKPGSAPAVMPGTNAIYVFLPERLEELEQIQERYLEGELKILSGYHANPLSYIYQVTAQ